MSASERRARTHVFNESAARIRHEHFSHSASDVKPLSIPWPRAALTRSFSIRTQTASEGASNCCVLHIHDIVIHSDICSILGSESAGATAAAAAGSLNLCVSRDKSLILTAPDLRMTWKEGRKEGRKANWSERSGGRSGKEEREERRIDRRRREARKGETEKDDGGGKERGNETVIVGGGRTGHLDLTARRTPGRTQDSEEGMG